MTVAEAQAVLYGPPTLGTPSGLGRRLAARFAGPLALLLVALTGIGVRLKPYATVGSIGALCLPVAAYLQWGAPVAVAALGVVLIVLEAAAEKGQPKP
jgi:hypothetical protein